MAEHKLFTFMKDDNRVYIASLTLEDAISALHELENISNVKYDVKNYSTKHVNIFPILNLDETYSDLPYILTEHQYKVVVSYLFDHKYQHLMTKKVVEKSEVKNCDSYKLDQSLNDTLNNLKNDTMDVLMKYMHQFNNKETHENICNDLTKLLNEKYSNSMNDIDEVEEKNKNANKIKLIVDNVLSMLQNKIKGED